MGGRGEVVGWRIGKCPRAPGNTRAPRQDYWDTRLDWIGLDWTGLGWGYYTILYYTILVFRLEMEERWTESIMVDVVPRGVLFVKISIHETMEEVCLVSRQEDRTKVPFPLPLPSSFHTNMKSHRLL